MSNEQRKLTRQEIYERIRTSSKDEYVLQEMIRLGFWPENQAQPSIEESLLKRRADIQKTLRELGVEQALYNDPQKALQALHKHRKQEALKRREETRQRNNQLRYEKSLHWFDKNQTDITYLGEGSGFELTLSNGHPERLLQQGLPEIPDSQTLAKLMGIRVHELRFLSFYRAVSKKDHYQHFELVKKTGGTRAIAAPMPRLKRAQYWILDNILLKPALNEHAHGFVQGRSIVTNGKPHTAQAMVINLDLENFFPTITRDRVKGLFTSLGYSEQIAAILANLCTAPKREQVILDDERYFVAVDERCLPQGAPTSPAISNLICRRLDARIRGVVASLGVNYSRYADDLTFSFSGAAEDRDAILKKLLWRVRGIITDEGFIVNESKTRIMRASQRQEVTGIVVNRNLSVDRKTLKQFRALLYQIDKDGFAGKRWGNGGPVLPAIEGYANFVAMVNPEKGIPLQKQVIHLKRKYNMPVKFGKVLALNNRLLRAKAAKGESPREGWWQPALPKPPTMEKTALQVQAEKQPEKKGTPPSEAVISPPVSQRQEEQRQARQESSKRIFERVQNNVGIIFLLIVILVIFWKMRQ